jgi:hypothetical protein
MRSLAIIAGICVLALSANAHAWWGPFDDDDGYNNQRWNNRNSNNWNNSLYDRWDDSVMGDLMGDLVGDMDVEMQFKVKAKGRGDANNRWNGNNRWYNNNRYNAYNYSGYNNRRYAPPYGYNNNYYAPAYNNYPAPASRTSGYRGNQYGNYAPQYQQPSRAVPVAQPNTRQR